MSAPRVWMYHAFGVRTAAQDPENLFVPEPSLREQLQTLLRGGATPLTLDGWLAALDGRPAPRRSFLVTIDDGYVSTLELAAPVLASLGVPAVLFVPPARLGGTSAWMPQMPDEPLLAGDRLRELPAHGIEVGVHGWDHALMRDMDDVALQRNTVQAGEAVADLVGTRPRSFAYPGGVHDTAAVTAVREAGYATAFSVSGNGVDGGRDARWAVPRVDVNATDTGRTFRVKASPLWPLASRAASRAPGLRAAAHRVLGSAR